jgi:DNA-binding LacI/PurR family transcriptional regulator
MSREATQILLNKMANLEHQPAGIIHLATKLVIRDSIKKIN